MECNLFEKVMIALGIIFGGLLLLGFINLLAGRDVSRSTIEKHYVDDIDVFMNEYLKTQKQLLELQVKYNELKKDCNRE